MPLRRIPAARDELKPRCTEDDGGGPSVVGTNGLRSILSSPLLSLPPTFAISNDDPIRAVLSLHLYRPFNALCRFGR